MSAPIAFESSWKKKEFREQKAQYREEYIEKLKVQHEREARKEEQRKLRGEDTWMLPSVSDRVDRAEQDLATSMKKKKKKEKKNKKEKKLKKKKKKSKSSESDSDTGEEEKWTESGKTTCVASQPVVKGPQIERDSWMIQPSSDFFGELPSITKSEFNDQRKKEKNKDKEETEEDKLMLEKPGRHKLELNPYWKEGGTGLPEEESGKKSKSTSSSFTKSVTAGDGGVGWWKKAYQRCVEAAKSEGRTLGEVAAERYGSLKKLESLIHSAEKSARKTDRRNSPDMERPQRGDRRDGRSDDRALSGRQRYEKYDSSSRKPSMFMKPGSDDDDDPQRRDRQRSRYSPSLSKRSFVRPRDDDNDDGDDKRQIDRKRDVERRSRRESPPRSVPRWKKSSEQSRKPQQRERSRSRERRRSRNSSRERSRSKERRRSRSRSRERRRSRSQSRERRRSRSQSRERRRSRSRSRERANRSPNQSQRIDDQNIASTNKDASSGKKNDRDFGQLHKTRRSPSSSSSSAESDSSSSSSDSEEEIPASTFQEPPPPKVLTEQELNELGAKLVRAEIMGDDDLAQKLKAQMDEARQLRSSQPALPRKPAGKEKSQSAEDETVVLTRTDRSGMVRPLGPGEYDRSMGKRRKQEKVKTHSTGGSRERYFHDDDNRDLKSLVEQEKLGTGADSNYEFLKLAGKAFKGKGKDPDEMDEMFMEGASKKVSQSTFDLKERDRAIQEHRKTTAVMEKCYFCFEKVPKHLIIAIGLKVYLCLPNHRSMTEGHCLIVPMQHVTQSTVLDEDIFEEIQVFRRALTKMYETQDLDCVFMETCLQLHKQRHMALECVPLPRELGDMAPIYFKKALQEAESEWSQNKKVVDLSKKNIRNAVPKGFPYFAVDFGLQGGFAHVVEDEKTFPFYFGREIVGGMMDLDPTYWRKPHKESFEDQRKKVLNFAEWWKPVDWTRKLKEAMDSD